MQLRRPGRPERIDCYGFSNGPSRQFYTRARARTISFSDCFERKPVRRPRSASSRPSQRQPRTDHRGGFQAGWRGRAETVRPRAHRPSALLVVLASVEDRERNRAPRRARQQSRVQRSGGIRGRAAVPIHVLAGVSANGGVPGTDRAGRWPSWWGNFKS